MKLIIARGIGNGAVWDNFRINRSDNINNKQQGSRFY